MPKDILNVIKKQKLATGAQALMACGMQQEFASHLMLMQQFSNTSLILRAGSPPMYDRPRSPKTGLNLSKTSTQGFFKGQIPQNKIFTRVKKDSEGNLHGIGHHYKDVAKLNIGEQNTVQLPIRLKDMIRELRSPGGDLQLSSYNPASGEVRFQYRKGKGDADFHGEFVINLNQGQKAQEYFSRSWDRLESDPLYNSQQDLIAKPQNANISDKAWQALYHEMQHQEYPLYYTDTPGSNELNQAKVFANDQGLIITGDWDGLATGHPPDLPEYASKVYNTFSTDLGEKFGLLQATRKLFNEKNNAIQKKADQGLPLTAFEQAFQKIAFKDLYNEFSVSRAGCITAHEFLNNSVANYMYKQKANIDIHDQAKIIGYQSAFDSGINHARQRILGGEENLYKIIEEAQQIAHQQFLTETLKAQNLPVNEKTIEDAMRSNAFEKTHQQSLDIIRDTLEVTIYDEHQIYKITNGATNPLISGETPTLQHPDADQNIENLFQHGYDMRNPYGSNLEGAWLMITDEGLIVHGETQEQLVEVLLTDGFLEKNHIDVNFAADMEKGWGDVVKRQIELGQNVPKETLHSYQSFEKIQKLTGDLERSNSWTGFLTAPSKDSIARQTEQIISDFPKHKQPLPKSLLENYFATTETTLNANKPLTDTQFQAIQSLIANHADLGKPAIPAAVAQAFINQAEKSLQSNPEAENAIRQQIASAQTLLPKTEPAQETNSKNKQEKAHDSASPNMMARLHQLTDESATKSPAPLHDKPTGPSKTGSFTNLFEHSKMQTSQPSKGTEALHRKNPSVDTNVDTSNTSRMRVK